MKTWSTFLAVLALPNLGFARDACQPLIPPALQMKLLKEFVGYRLPRESDNLQEDVMYARDHGGSGCLGVETADFDGDGRADYLVALTSADGKGALVVVAMTRGSTWKFYKLDMWPEWRSRLYVSSEPPGVYEDVGDTDGPLEKGAEERLKCPHSLAAFGETEASEVAYCFVNSAWKHIWISD